MVYKLVPKPGYGEARSNVYDSLDLPLLADGLDPLGLVRIFLL